MKVYLDNAATTPLAPEVLEAMMPFMTEHYGNPSAQHAFGRQTRAAIEQARKSVAGHLNARPSEIVFTSGGTESNNLALLSAVRNHGVKRVISMPIEHHCVLHTLEALHEQFNVEVIFLPVDREGRADLGRLEELLQQRGQETLVSVMHGNNEVGTIQDLGAIGKLTQAAGALFHSDTVQTMGHYPLDVQTLPIHFLVGSAHKFHGPKGAGFLFVRKGMQISPLLYGGGQERNKRAGTENVYGIIGLSAALDMAYEHLDEEQRYISDLKDYFLSGLQERFDTLAVNGAAPGSGSLYTVLNVSFPNHPQGTLLLFNLDMAGVAASGGSACNSGASTGSHVIEALGGTAGIPVRFSFSRYTTREALDFALEKIRVVFGAGVPSN